MEILILSVISTAGQSNPAGSSKDRAVPVVTKATITLIARDVQTGYSVAAKVSYGPMQGDWSIPSSKKADGDGRLHLTLPIGTYLFEMCAPGYDSMRSYYPVTPASSLTFQLDPTVPPLEMRPEVLNAQMRPGYAMVFGYVVDDTTGKALRNAHVRLQRSQIETKTTERGYYALFAPVPVPTPSADPSSLPPTDTMIVELPGYTTLVYDRLPLYEGQWSGENMQLGRGSGTTESKFSARWMPDDIEHAQASEPDQPAPHPIPEKLLQWLSVPSHPCPRPMLRLLELLRPL